MEALLCYDFPLTSFERKSEGESRYAVFSSWRIDLAKRLRELGCKKIQQSLYSVELDAIPLIRDEMSNLGVKGIVCFFKVVRSGEYILMAYDLPSRRGGPRVLERLRWRVWNMVRKGNYIRVSNSVYITPASIDQEFSPGRIREEISKYWYENQEELDSIGVSLDEVKFFVSRVTPIGKFNELLSSLIGMEYKKLLNGLSTLTRKRDRRASIVKKDIRKLNEIMSRDEKLTKFVEESIGYFPHELVVMRALLKEKIRNAKIKLKRDLERAENMERRMILG
ncbi:hypothetical protein DRN46_06910 [Thermococci archaeon]|nr:MAG: hypothetical protein DRN46_06910 [Thermococci archaeon]